jgi:hypothetical protein
MLLIGGASMSNNLIAYCGLYCGACSFRVAYESSNNEHITRMPSQYDHLKNITLEYCPGCKLDNQCGDCDIRDCARSKGIEHCGLCCDFPCAKLVSFNKDGKPHHAESISNLNLLREIGEAEWLELQNEKWSCKCGTKYSWYMNECEKCIGTQ